MASSDLPLTPSHVVSGTTTPQAAQSNTSSSDNGQMIAGNFQTFLTLLTTQLQNQNPMDPLDTNQFTQQLVQFASVEQQLKTNDSLSTLVSQQHTAQDLTQALGFVGKTATVDGSTTALLNSSATWQLDIPNGGNLNVSIVNSAGLPVYSKEYAVASGDNQSFHWNGTGNDGTQWADGSYELVATVTDHTGKSVGVTSHIEGVISSADLTQSPPLLMVHGKTYMVSQIKSVSP